MRLPLAVLAALALLWPAHARNLNGQYDNNPDWVREWYAKAELTPEAQKRFGFKSCCAQSDKVETRFQVDRSSAADTWYWLNPETGNYQRVPDDIIHWGESGPYGEAILFAVGGKPTCFYPAKEGG